MKVSEVFIVDWARIWFEFFLGLASHLSFMRTWLGYCGQRLRGGWLQHRAECSADFHYFHVSDTIHFYIPYSSNMRRILVEDTNLPPERRILDTIMAYSS